MLKGKTVTLRPVLEEDLPQVYEHLLNLQNRGAFFNLDIRTLTEMRTELAKGGLWGADQGHLNITDNSTGKVLGQIGWGRTVRYMDEIEVGYILWDEASRKAGRTTEALTLFTNYLFDVRVLDGHPLNRIRLCIATGNTASRRVAEKAGFIHEGTQRCSVNVRGQCQDMELYAILRSDPRPAL